jgi:hypothetical protein
LPLMRRFEEKLGRIRRKVIDVTPQSRAPA